MNLNDRALLVQLSISQWTARKFDKKATQKVADEFGSKVDQGRFNKALLPVNDLLGNVHKMSTEIRTFYYDNTLAWGVDGLQMLPTKNYLGFTTEFRAMKSRWERMVVDFNIEYPTLVREAQRVLGGLYDPNDYPADVRSKFGINLRFSPVPSDDFRVSIAGEELDRIRAEVRSSVSSSYETAMKDVWQRIYDRVQHMAEKLADPKAIFRDSLVDNIKEQCALLSRLNFMDDPNLEAMRQHVEGSLIKHPDALRNDPDLRRDTAAEAKAIMDKMSVFMGGL
jgi:hypothetical protein